MKYVNAIELVDLLKQDGLCEAVGKIVMELNGVKVKVKQNDVVGNVLQEWLCEWLKKNEIYYRPAVGQTFPDFYLSEDNYSNLCEMKAYIAKRGPGFDIANFDSYWKSLVINPIRLDSDYLIFAYDSDEDGNISVKNVYAKKVWEITSEAEGCALKCQRKNGQIYNIRPCTFASERAKFQPFNDKELFLSALYKTVVNHTNKPTETKDWLKTVLEKYNKLTDSNINYRNII